MSVRAGRIIKVDNKNPHYLANKSYLAVWVEDADGDNERCLLFTEGEIERAEHRSRQNLEDWTSKGLIADLFD